MRRQRPAESVVSAASEGANGGAVKRAHRERRIEHISTVLLALAAVGTAWAGYQANWWHGEQAKAQSVATAKRVESTRASGVANRQEQIDVALFIQWVDAEARGQHRLARFYRERFTDRLTPAFNAWIVTKPLQNPDARSSPFETRAYRVPATQQVARFEAQAAAASEEAKVDIRHSDSYVLAVVLFSVSLFFAGISTRLRTPRAEARVLVLGCAVFLGTAIWLATLPTSF
jgi:hypothetical protein